MPCSNQLSYLSVRAGIVPAGNRARIVCGLVSGVKKPKLYFKNNIIGGCMTLNLVAEGLQFPEGPVAMADGSVIVVEMRRRA